MSTARKARLPWGEGPKKFGGLQDRESAKEALYKGLEYLARSRGNPAVDKKKIPLLGIAAPSESGKTEFLRWIFNECCSYNEDAGETAQDLLLRINNASPETVPKLNRIIVLFASFNQRSPYSVREGPIEVTVIERLVRSFHGRIDMRGFDADLAVLRNFDDLVNLFSKENENTGFIVCIDELSKVRDLNSEEYTTLMDALMSFSQNIVSEGGYFGVVGTSIRIYDFGQAVVQASRRAMWHIALTSNPVMTEERTRAIVTKSQACAGAANRVDEAAFQLRVALQVARSSPKMTSWLALASSEREIYIPTPCYEIPQNFDADIVFEVAARTALGETREEPMRQETYETIVDALQGNARLCGQNNDGSHVDWPLIPVILSLPPWRLLQFTYPCGGKQVFTHVQDWVLVELHRLFYIVGPSEAVKTWELATMGLLELRRAMLHVVKGSTPTLCEIIDGVGVFTNVSNDLLDSSATPEPASNVCENLPLSSKSSGAPCFYHAKKSNEEGVEGVFRNGFHKVAVFFQMKLYSRATSKEIKEWLVKAARRAAELGYKEGTYIVQLFVTGTKSDNVKKHYDDWPPNSMVFADDAIRNLLAPFGDGLFVEMVKMRRRDN